MDEALAVTLQVTGVLDQLRVRYVVGGSIASSIYGKPRSTQDVDVIADLGNEHISPFIAALRNDFYLDEPAIRDAVGRRSTFNVIHLLTMFKVDVFVAKDDAATVQELARSRSVTVQWVVRDCRLCLPEPLHIVAHEHHRAVGGGR